MPLRFLGAAAGARRAISLAKAGVHVIERDATDSVAMQCAMQKLHADRGEAEPFIDCTMRAQADEKTLAVLQHSRRVQIGNPDPYGGGDAVIDCREVDSPSATLGQFWTVLCALDFAAKMREPGFLLGIGNPDTSYGNCIRHR